MLTTGSVERVETLARRSSTRVPVLELTPGGEDERVLRVGISAACEYAAGATAHAAARGSPR